MNRKELESLVKLDWESPEFPDRPFHKCTASFPLTVPGYLAIGEPPEARAQIEHILRRSFAHSILGDQETEVLRLRAAVDKWARRAMVGSMSRQIEPDQWANELAEDLR